MDKLVIFAIVVICILFFLYYNSRPTESFHSGTGSYIPQRVPHGMTENKQIAQYEQTMQSENDANRKIILIHATWCGHCKRFLPIWEEIKQTDKSGINYQTVEAENIEKTPILTKEEKNVTAFPTIIFKDGAKVEKVEGGMSKTDFEAKKEQFFNIKH